MGVVFYVLLALRARLRQAGHLADPPPDLGVLLDLVAVGTVADLGGGGSGHFHLRSRLQGLP